MKSLPIPLFHKPILICFELCSDRSELVLQLRTAHVKHVQHHRELDVLQHLGVDGLLLLEVEPDHLDGHVARQPGDGHALGVLRVSVQGGTPLMNHLSCRIQVRAVVQ